MQVPYTLVVACYLSHVTNAKNHSHRPLPCQLPQYAQQDTGADLDLHPLLTMSQKDQQINYFQRFLTISEPKFQSLSRIAEEQNLGVLRQCILAPLPPYAKSNLLFLQV